MKKQTEINEEIIKKSFLYCYEAARFSRSEVWAIRFEFFEGPFKRLFSEFIYQLNLNSSYVNFFEKIINSKDHKTVQLTNMMLIIKQEILLGLALIYLFKSWLENGSLDSTKDLKMFFCKINLFKEPNNFRNKFNETFDFLKVFINFYLS